MYLGSGCGNAESSEALTKDAAQITGQRLAEPELQQSFIF